MLRVRIGGLELLSLLLKSLCLPFTFKASLELESRDSLMLLVVLAFQQFLAMMENDDSGWLRRLAAIQQHYIARQRAIERWFAKRRARERWFARRCLARARLFQLAQEGPPRRWWVYPRDSHWWRAFSQRIWEDEQWLESFRMTRATFFWLVDILRPRLERATTEMRKAIPVEQRVAIAVWWMANATSYRLVGNQFGLARSTISGIVTEVCLALKEELLRKVVKLGPYGRVSAQRYCWAWWWWLCNQCLSPARLPERG